MRPVRRRPQVAAGAAAIALTVLAGCAPGPVQPYSTALLTREIVAHGGSVDPNPATREVAAVRALARVYDRRRDLQGQFAVTDTFDTCGLFRWATSIGVVEEPSLHEVESQLQQLSARAGCAERTDPAAPNPG